MNEVSIECVIFGYESRQLKVLISELKFKGDFFALPSGFIYRDEDVKDAAGRILFERTGLRDLYLDEFCVFGKADRQRKSFLDQLIQQNYSDSQEEKMASSAYQWFTNRFISIGYYALVDINEVDPKPTALDKSMSWYDVHDVPDLIMDHKQILDEAYHTLKVDMDSKLNAFNLLPEKFTMKQVQEIYETIYQQSFTRTNFQRKILNMDVLERLEKKFTGAKNKAPYLYKMK